MSGILKKRVYLVVLVFFVSMGTAFAETTIRPEERKNIDVMKSSIVRIFSFFPDGGASGSGFAVTDNMFVTNKHVIEDSDEIIIVGPEKKKTIAVKVWFPDDKNLDLALVRVAEDIGCIPVVFPPSGEFSKISSGQNAVAMGYPGVAEEFDITYALGKEGITVTKGSISRLVENTDTRLLQLDVAIEHGNSGGPLFDELGRVIGINSLGIDGTSAKWAINAIELLPFLIRQGIAPVRISAEEIKKTDDDEKKQWFSEPNLYITLLGFAGVMFIAGAFLLSRRGARHGRKKEIPYKPENSLISIDKETQIASLANLIGTEGVFLGKPPFPIRSFPFWIGRDPKCGIVLPPDIGTVSRRHCYIDKNPSGQGMMIYDNSANGTIVNGRILTKGMSERLIPGSTITFKDCKASLRFDIHTGERDVPDKTASAPSANLIGIGGVHAGKRFSIQSFPFWIGREPDCGVVLPANLNAISRKHCYIDKAHSGQGFMICDDSINGTIVNGRTLTKGILEPLMSGSILIFKSSNESFRFEVRDLSV
ncbi:MAG: FHA domain-containing protein [Synergistaceae bacterium]|jgi:pSer/pThr/pTyr-binding forkhead associated (FHA) protein|nr:FHA domain-containing protein [Synergistaceae bacterium]